MKHSIFLVVGLVVLLLSHDFTVVAEEASADRPGPAAVADRIPGEERVIDLGGGIKLEMVWIPKGHFQMGSPAEEKGRSSREGPVHKVTLSKGFWMGKYEVTQAQWKQVMTYNPSLFKEATKTKPVERVNWDDCGKFIEKLNKQIKGDTFRLPTEAEWEYACRAGTKTRYYFGDKQSDLVKAAWYYGNREKKTQPVGQKEPNAWGLYDMYGNVWEWCSDWHGIYSEGPQVDPQGPLEGSNRVARGGSWIARPSGLRSAYRGWCDPRARDEDRGFRCVRVQSR